jgi:RimJ/RimL family protein N-acetyltransferase
MAERVWRTKRLLLRVPVETDIDFVAALFSRQELVAHRPDPTPDTREESARRLARDMGHWRSRGFGRWAVEADSGPIGFGGVTVSREFEGLNLSYHLHPDSWGKGYATELVRQVLDFAFNGLHAERVIGLVRPVNVASRNVLEKCGFTLQREVMLHGAPTELFAFTA